MRRSGRSRALTGGIALLTLALALGFGPRGLILGGFFMVFVAAAWITVRRRTETVAR
jgi:hypothetical protein